MSAERRRAHIVRLALSEFSTGGYYGTSTERIADLAGISQPYVFRLFTGKSGLFRACADLCFDQLTDVLMKAAEQRREDESALESMGVAYHGLIADQSVLLFQLQMYLYVASTSTEPELAEMVRRRWMTLWDAVRKGSGSSDAEVNRFFAAGMYINTLIALDIPLDSRCWAGLRPAGPE
ncbi:MAG TPA: helix-turn-helix domain-containing protein [Actinocrinis sp.]|jgi:AcrR family transcriptional regulator